MISDSDIQYGRRLSRQKKNDQKEITSQTADKHDTIMTGINELKGDDQENC